MKKQIKKFLLFVFSYVLLASPLLAAGTPSALRPNNVQSTEAYNPSYIRAELKVDVKDNDVVHFIRDNNNPFIVTKTYRLKYADPYEIRVYINTAIQANKIAGNPTVVDCIKYNDGTGLIMVGAEDFRFTSNENGMSIDDIVAKLDVPKLQSASGQKTYLYFPRYWNAQDLATVVSRIGANTANATTQELRYGADDIQFDQDLNCLFMYTPQYSKKTLQQMIKLYDVPFPEVDVSFKLYELDSENDGKIGADWTAWKNAGGMDFFSAGYQASSGWGSSWATGMAYGNAKASDTGYFNFNPKWNTRYLDLLVSKGSAKVVTSGNIAILNKKTGTITKGSRVFRPELTKEADNGLIQYIVINNVGNNIREQPQNISNVIDSEGNSYATAATGPRLTITKIQFSGQEPTYRLKASNGITLTKTTPDGATTAGLTSATDLVSCDVWTTDSASGNTLYTNWITVDSNDKGYKETVIPSNNIGFAMTITPNVCQSATTLDVNMTNSSLIGWDSDGAPRINENSNVTTKIMMSNDGGRFIIGGLEKQSVVSSVSGFPILKDLPVLGWLFSTESESTKNSQLVLVLECSLNQPDTTTGSGDLKSIMKIKDAVKDSGQSNSWGASQYLIGSRKMDDVNLMADDINKSVMSLEKNLTTN